MRKALEAVNLINEKRNGIIKGKKCIDGSKQKRYLKEGESISSPTVSLEDLFCTLIVDAHEGRNVANLDVPGQYLYAKTPKDNRILINLRGDLVDIMCQVNPEYDQHVIYENEKKRFVSISVLREIYGCIESALLWYNIFYATLQGLVF